MGLPLPYFVLLARLGSGTSGWPTHLGLAASIFGETSLGDPPSCLFSTVLTVRTCKSLWSSWLPYLELTAHFRYPCVQSPSLPQRTFILTDALTISLVLYTPPCPIGRRAFCRLVLFEGLLDPLRSLILDFGHQGYEVEAQPPGPLTPLVQVWLGCLLSAQIVPSSLLSAWSFLARTARRPYRLPLMETPVLGSV
jgi:hypothetical protein